MLAGWQKPLDFSSRKECDGMASERTPRKVRHVEGQAPRRSTGIRGNRDEPIGEAFGALMKGIAFSASMASDLAMVEDQGQGIGKKPNHGQHHQGRGLVDSTVFEVTVGGDGLKNFCVDSPTAATELMNEQRQDRAKFEIGGVEVGALLRHRRLALDSMTVFFADSDAIQLLDANRFNDSHQAVGHGPIDLRQVPISNLPVRLGVNAGGRFLRETLSLAQ